MLGDQAIYASSPHSPCTKYPGMNEARQDG